MRHGLMILAVVAGISAGSAAAQTPLREGTVEKLNLVADLRAEAATQSVHWSARVEEPGVRSIRLHLTDIAPGSAGDYTIVFSDRQREVGRVGKAEIGGSKEMWTGVVSGDYVRVEVVAATRPTGLSFKISEAVFERTPFHVYSITIPDEREAVVKYEGTPDLFGRTRAIAKLTFVADGFGSSCTGFLIDNEHMMTNHHCVATEEVCKTAVATFGYQLSSTGQLNPGKQYRCLAVKKADSNLDMALLKLDGNPGAEWGSLELTRRAVTLNEQTYMIQHPAGEPKQISRKGCMVSTLDAPGSGGPATKTDLGHKCDTLGGSSGSPLLGHDFRVVGLHHFGFGGGGQWNSENRAVQIRLVMDLLGMP